jgi:predicted neuraminidase
MDDMRYIVAMQPGSVSLIRLVLFAALMLAGSFLPAQTQPLRELIFKPGSAPFAASHASTIVEMKDGSLMAAWFGGTAEGKPDVAIWGSHRIGSAWSAPVELVREPSVPCWNPVLFHTTDGHLWLYYKFGPSPGTWTAGRMFSLDDGKTWSAPEHLPAGLVGPVRAKPYVMPDGTIVSGTSFETYRSWAVWIERSTDQGKTWAKIGPIVPPLDLDLHGLGDARAEIPSQVPGSEDWKYTNGIIQPSVVPLGGAHLRLYARSTAKTARVSVADSYDNGVTWTQARPLDVPNPNSGIDAVALKDGRVVLIYNNTTSGRTPLNLAVSSDGEHFKMFYTLEDAPGEDSYPAIIQSSNGDIYMTYTWDRRSIEFVRFPLAQIPGNPAPLSEKR